MNRCAPAAAWILLTLITSGAETARNWTDQRGRKFEATLVAVDAVRGTFLLPDGRKTVASIAALSSEDAAFIREWRRNNPRASLIDPEAMPPWPAEVVPESFDVRMVEEDHATGATRYASPHFTIASDLKLPLEVVRDLATVFEATRAAVMAVPLALHSGIERGPYPVRLFSKTEDYQASGGPTGSGGFFNGRETLILLPNLGIHATTSRLSAEHQRQLFVVKHEVSHQLVGRWTGAQPPWLSEGIAELFAAAPYTRGRYSFQNLESALQAYVLKWRSSRDSRSVRLIAPPRLMTTTLREWHELVTAHRAYDLYNSSALLAYWFVRYDGRGDAAGLAAYYDALHRRVSPEEAEREFLLRGRTREQLTGELQKLARKMALSVQFE